MTELTQPVARQVVFDGVLGTAGIEVIRAVPIAAPHAKDLRQAVVVEDAQPIQQSVR